MGQLGMGEDVLEAKRPRSVLELASTDVVCMVAGGGANAILVNSTKTASKKEIWSWGCNDHAVLGRVTKGDKESSTPGVISDLADKDIVQISLGDYHMLCLESNGHVWSWGTYRDANGILGFKPGNHKQTTPELMAELKDKRIVAVASGENTSYALTDNGLLYMWGDARINQRTSARGNNKHACLLPSIIPASKKYVALFAGGFHVLLIANDGTLWAMGLNNHDQLGTGGDELVTIPKAVRGLPKDIKIKMCALGQHHSVMLTEDGHVYSWGRGEYGQLGHGKKENVSEPKRVEFFQALHKQGNPVVQVACGGHHTLATMKNGDVYSWGFGTMYQLGIGEITDGDEDRILPTKLNNEDPRSKLHAKKVTWSCGGGQHSIFAIQ